jgi:biopolymer transport protein TolR
MAEINVTPLVDVMLVLLIIFMVAAPMMTAGVPLDLPKTSAAPLNQETEPLTISVNAEGRIFLQETEVAPEALLAQLQAILREQKPDQPQRRILVRGDRGVPYGRVAEVMSTIQTSGFTRVALLSDPGAAAAPAAPAGAARSGATPPSRAIPVQPAPAQTPRR